MQKHYYIPKSNPKAPILNRARDREKLQSDVEKFVAGGGKITEVEYLYTTIDPTRKPGYDTRL